MAIGLTKTLREYYRSPAVHRRMAEFLGGRTLGTATAAYVTATDGYSDFTSPARPERLSAFLREGLDVERSLWDSDSLIVDVDIDHHNFDRPAASYLDPVHAITVQAPVVRSLLSNLSGAIAPLQLISGRGYHFVWSVSRQSKAFYALEQLGRIPYSLRMRYRRQKSPAGARLPASLGLAFAGLGMVLEHLAQRAIGTMPRSGVPVQITAVEVGPTARGREIVSLDLSEYGDPLHARHVRIPFSTYLKPRQLIWAMGAEAVGRLLPIFAIPLAGMNSSEALGVMRQPGETLRLAKHVETTVPDASGGMIDLIEEYRRSDLASFHDWFYATGAVESKRVARRMEPALRDELPDCVLSVFDQPNDWLLKPAVLQHIVRVLMALGWHPHSIASLIKSRYESDAGWGPCWSTLDPAWRATFYTRLFAGLVATGADRLIDMNCVSHGEKGYCTVTDCRRNLADFRDRLERRSFHE